MNPYVRPGHILRKPSLIALSRLGVISLKSASWRYCASSGFVDWSRMLFTTISNFYLQGYFPHSCFIFSGTFYYLVSIILDCNLLLV